MSVIVARIDDCIFDTLLVYIIWEFLIGYLQGIIPDLREVLTVILKYRRTEWDTMR